MVAAFRRSASALPLTLVALVALAACTAGVAPDAVTESTAPAWARAAEVIVEVDLDRLSAQVLRPGQTIGTGPVPLTVSASNVSVTGIGVGAPAGLRRVRLSLGLAASAAPAHLTATQRVVAPPGQHGVLVIPHEASVVADSGRVQVERGNELVVELPSRGRVVPSPDFNGNGSPGGGEPFAFFVAARCASPRPDGACMRYETLPAGPAPSGVVGFDVEPLVRRFRARLLVAADAVPPQPSSVSALP